MTTQPVMNLRKISGACEEDDCPTVYLSDRNTLVVQGDAVTVAHGLRLGEGELAVELPISVVREAIRELA